MRQTAILTLALALGIAAALLFSSCGEEDAELLPGATANEITANLDAVKQLADEGECAGAAGAAQEVNSQVEALEGVDAKLKQALERGTARLSEVVATCEEATTETAEPAEEETATEEDLPPGQAKKAEKEQEKEEKEERKEEKGEDDDEGEEGETPPGPPTTETTPIEPPPSEDGGTGAPGGVSPATPAPEAEDD